jgi:hypothetical protein
VRGLRTGRANARCKSTLAVVTGAPWTFAALRGSAPKVTSSTDARRVGNPQRYLTCVFGLETMNLAIVKANCSVLI